VVWRKAETKHWPVKVVRIGCEVWMRLPNKPKSNNCTDASSRRGKSLSIAEAKKGITVHFDKTDLISDSSYTLEAYRKIASCEKIVRDYFCVCQVLIHSRDLHIFYEEYTGS